MSFDLFVWDPPSPSYSDPDVVARYERACEAEEEDEADAAAGESPRVAAFLQEVFSRHPPLDDLPDDGVDDSPWCGGEGRSDRWAVFTIRWSMAEQMREWLGGRARAHGLVLFDPQANEVVHPPAVVRV